MSKQSLESALRSIYSNENLTKKFADNPKATLETLGVDTSDVKIGDAILPSPEEVGQICASLCPGVPIVNACVGYEVGEDV